jgi:pimeloyl-ACP methyl ester carboxylesterase
MNISSSNLKPIRNKKVEFTDFFEKSNLTRLQALYWISQNLRPTAPFLNTILTFTIDGPVNHDHFQNAFQEVIHQSDALRTVITEISGVPQRKVTSDFPDKLELVDLSEEPDTLEAFDTWLAYRASIPLNLERHLFDAALLKISSQKYVWYLNQHHINADATSFFVIFDQLAAYYENFSEGSSLDKSDRPTFEAYVDYERRNRQSPQFTKAESYWRRKLIPGPEPLRFFGRPPLKQTTVVERKSYGLGTERSKKIRDIAKQEGIYSVSEEYSVYNLFAALFFILLHQLSGNRRLGFVTPVHNRFADASRKTIGLLMELCPLQIEISDNDTFLSVVKKVRREARETMVFSQYGSSLSLESGGFDVMFNFHSIPALRLNGISVEPKRIHPGHGSESLAFHVNDFRSTEEFVLHFDFHDDVFDDEQRNRTLEAFLKLVDTCLDDHTKPVGKVNLSSNSLDDAIKVGERIDRQKIQYLHQSRAEWYRALVSRRDPIEFQLTRIWEDVFGIRPIDVKDDFFDLGGSSFLAVRLFAQIEELTGKNLPLATLLKAATIEDQARILRDNGWSTSWSSLVPIQPIGNKPPFFCVHGGGGNVIHFRVLAYYLDPDQPFYGLQPQGMDGKQPFHTSVEDMAEYYIQEIRAIQPEGPYFLGGYCFGATVAYEMAQQLISQGQEVAFLVSFGGATWDYPESLGSLSERAVRHLRELVSLQPNDALLYIQERAKRRFLRFQKRMRKSVQKNQIFKRVLPGVESSGPHPPHYFHMVSTLRKNFRDYQPRIYPGRLTLFRAAEYHDPLLGWGGLVEEGIDDYELSCHELMDMFQVPFVRDLATNLRVCLEEARINRAGK